MGARRTVTILRKGYRVMLDLNEIRKQIDATDQEIVRLFEQRIVVFRQKFADIRGIGDPVDLDALDFAFYFFDDLFVRNSL